MLIEPFLSKLCIHFHQNCLQFTLIKGINLISTLSKSAALNSALNLLNSQAKYPRNLCVYHSFIIIEPNSSKIA